MNTISDIKRYNFKPNDLLKEFLYQKTLTPRLDAYNGAMNQEKINEIVLWKTNRYAEIDPATMLLLNEVKASDRILNLDLTHQILSKLLSKSNKGVRLPMASTILRFRNSTIYQIIDRRAYRVVYGKDYKEFLNTRDRIDLYLQYLHDIRELSEKLDTPFHTMDRLLYMLDKKINKNLKI